MLGAAGDQPFRSLAIRAPVAAGPRRSRTSSGEKAASRAADGRQTFELALPKTLLPRNRAAAEKRLVMSLSFLVPDCGDDEPEKPGPGSFSYQVRYGGDAFVQVNFVELILLTK